jgi:hypothetical protein
MRVVHLSASCTNPVLVRQQVVIYDNNTRLLAALAEVVRDWCCHVMTWTTSTTGLDYSFEVRTLNYNDLWL